jgi:mannose-1-phosphate guanylyltransferase
VYAAILAGGKGKRFWPASTAQKPKQFLDLTGEGSMLSLTWKRLRSFIPADRILVLTACDQAEAVKAQLPELIPENLFGEPESRNTAPSLAVASAILRARNIDEPLLCCPSDHLIIDGAGFEAAVAAAARAADSSNVIVTFGIEPAGPETGYGYIESSSDTGDIDEAVPLKVEKFHEKPDRETAQRYLDMGNFYWNSGIFVWRPSVFVDTWNRYLPEGTEPLRAIEAAAAEGRIEEAAGKRYCDLPSTSVDFGILEKTDNVVVLPVSFGWSDVGSWDALKGVIPGDGEGNAGAGEMELIDSRGNIIYNPDGITALIDVEDMIVAVSGGRVLVCRRGESQRVREILERLEAKAREEHL